MPGDVVRRLIEGKDTQRGKNMMTSTAGLLCQAIINLRDFIETYSKRNPALQWYMRVEMYNKDLGTVIMP